MMTTIFLPWIACRNKFSKDGKLCSYEDEGKICGYAQEYVGQQNCISCKQPMSNWSIYGQVEEWCRRKVEQLAA